MYRRLLCVVEDAFDLQTNGGFIDIGKDAATLMEYAGHETVTIIGNMNGIRLAWQDGAFYVVSTCTAAGGQY